AADCSEAPKAARKELWVVTFDRLVRESCVVLAATGVRQRTDHEAGGIVPHPEPRHCAGAGRLLLQMRRAKRIRSSETGGMTLEASATTSVESARPRKQRAR